MNEQDIVELLNKRKCEPCSSQVFDSLKQSSGADDVFETMSARVVQLDVCASSQFGELVDSLYSRAELSSGNVGRPLAFFNKHENICVSVDRDNALCQQLLQFASLHSQSSQTCDTISPLASSSSPSFSSSIVKLFAYALAFDDRTPGHRMHCDDSQLTLNWCVSLSRDAVGGDLVFANDDVHVEPRLGRLIVHRGDTVHGSESMRSGGQRLNVIVWCWLGNDNDNGDGDTRAMFHLFEQLPVELQIRVACLLDDEGRCALAQTSRAMRDVACANVAWHYNYARLVDTVVDGPRAFSGALGYSQRNEFEQNHWQPPALYVLDDDDDNELSNSGGAGRMLRRQSLRSVHRSSDTLQQPPLPVPDRFYFEQWSLLRRFLAAACRRVTELRLEAAARIVTELVSTERQYCTMLAEMCDDLRALVGVVSDGHALADATDSADTLRATHTAFLCDLEAVLGGGAPSTSQHLDVMALAQAFGRHFPLMAGPTLRHLSLYESFIELLDKSKADEHLAAKAASSSSRCHMSLKSHLVAPIRRIPRYRLLVADMAKYGDAPSSDSPPSSSSNAVAASSSSAAAARSSILDDIVAMLDTMSNELNQKMRIKESARRYLSPSLVEHVLASVAVRRIAFVESISLRLNSGSTSSSVKRRAALVLVDDTGARHIVAMPRRFIKRGKLVTKRSEIDIVSVRVDDMPLNRVLDTILSLHNEE
jgi:RhoGEF domain